ncbi:MAG: glycyl-radical enzyme activating protein [Clostridiales bacterium]|nr:glycyl-radical enzyme activating protein [Clostridiales bacterium]
MAVGKVFSIEEFSVHDGPGVRTSVFLKGCSLRCIWCHNPEGQNFSAEIYKNIHGCTGCGACLEAGRRASGERKLTQESIAVCPRHLLRQCGKDYTAEELVAVILGYKNFYRDGGGVTFTGGEPLAQPEFLAECLGLLRGKVHRAIQTSGFAESEVFRQILSMADYVLYDLKIMDGKESEKHMGANNDRILDNFAILAQSGVPYVVRVPLIPTVTDTESNLRAIADFMVKNGAKYAELMPYNKLAGSKYAAVNRKYSPSFDESAAKIPSLEIFEERGIKAKII